MLYVYILWCFILVSNYAPTIDIQRRAMLEHGCQQVLWLYGDDHKLTEVGTMNIFMFWVNEAGGNQNQNIILPMINSFSSITALYILKSLLFTLCLVI